MHWWSRLLVSVLLLSSASQAWAQFGTTPSDGVRLPETSIVGRDDALSLELNPAGLAFVQKWDAHIVVSTADSDLLAGTGVFVGGNILGAIGLGGAVQWVQNPELGGNFRKFTLGLATDLMDRASLGLTFNYFDHDRERAVDRLHSFDAGLQIRVTEWLGVAGAVRDLNTPRLGGTTLRPRYVAGLGVRFAEGRYRLEFDGIHQATDDDWFLRARVALEPINGLGIHVESQTTAVDDFDIHSLTAGLTLSLGSSAVTTSASFGLEDGADFVATSTGLRASGRPQRALVEPHGFMAGLRISGSLPERGGSSFIFGRQASFLDLLRHIDALSLDEHIDGVVVTIENASYGFGQHWELHQALTRVRERGKQVVVYLNSADFGDVYLASAADRVYMHPGINFSPRGLSTTMMYIGDLLENIGVEAEFVRIAEYKSAPEQFLNSGPSEYALEAINAYYDDAYDEMVSAIAEGRGVTTDDVRSAVDTSPHSAGQAVEAGLLDGACFPDELEGTLSDAAGRRVRIANGYDPDWQRDYTWTAPPTVAVVYVDGSIVSGESGNMPIAGALAGHRSVISSLEAAVKLPGIAGIVLRVDSPGGSAWASEHMWRAVQQANESVPVVVSMADVAASGGYYVAMGGTEVLATDLTVTGSIGVFYGHFSAARLLGFVGVNRYPIQRGAAANLFGIEAPWTETERDSAMREIQLMYDVFLARVSENRDSTPEEIDPLARGRVWSGQRAADNGLVDRLGGLLDAIDRVKHHAGIPADDPVRLRVLPERSTLSMLTSSIGIQAHTLQELAPLLEALGLGHALRLPLLYADTPAARMEFELVGEE